MNGKPTIFQGEWHEVERRVVLKTRHFDEGISYPGWLRPKQAPTVHENSRGCPVIAVERFAGSWLVCLAPIWGFGQSQPCDMSRRQGAILRTNNVIDTVCKYLICVAAEKMLVDY